jgi:dTDP-glucose pyrophosphorylase
MKCLIIAAGKGSRLRLTGDSKPLIPISGVPKWSLAAQPSSAAPRSA